MSLDVLQGDKTMCMGYLLPTITWLTKQLNELKITGGSCKALAESCLHGVEKRFEYMLHDNTIILAALSHPKFKIRWLSGAKKCEASEILQLEFDSTPCIENIVTNSLSNQEIEDNFCFNNDDFEESQTEIERFMKNPFTSDLTTFNTMPVKKEIFVKYNTALPSSASVERLFSVAGDICSKKRACMTDKNFEDTLFCKVNIKHK